MLSGLLHDIVGTIAAFVLGAAVCTLVEMLLPAERQSMASRARGFCFSLVSLAAAVVATRATQEGMAWAGLEPLFRLDLSQTIHAPNPLVAAAGYVLVPLVAILFYDIFYYVFHRLQHSVPLLWRYHAVHHSIEELNAFNSYHHVSEYLFRIPLLTIPLNMLIWVGEPQVVVMATIIAIVGKISHSSMRVSFGPLRYLMTEPRFHRIHHSIEPQHWNRNFAFYFPLLDVIFGTAHFPAKGEYPRTGLNYLREPRGLREFLFPPPPPTIVATEGVQVGVPIRS